MFAKLKRQEKPPWFVRMFATTKTEAFGNWLLRLVMSTALHIATEQKAHSLELRAALDLYDLLAELGRDDEGRDLLSSILDNEDVAWTPDRPEPMRARAILARPLIEMGASHGG